MKDDVQQRWSEESIRIRLKILKSARHQLAESAEAIVASLSPVLSRTPADTLVCELLPLLEACKFLERNAETILRSRRLGSSGRPLWLHGVRAEVRREALGHIVVIAPSNFPLFLAGVQVLQALAAGNRVTWKPGSGGKQVALLVASSLSKAGLPDGLLTVTDDTVEAAHAALALKPDKVFFTGSNASGTQVLAELAKEAIPAVMELSGVDAVVVLPSANLKDAAEAIAFGLRLNGAAVCMSPRRLIADSRTSLALRPLLESALASIGPVSLDARTAILLRQLLDEAHIAGASVRGEWNPASQRPVLVVDATSSMSIAQTSVSAPVISMLNAASQENLPDICNASPYGLTVSIFGDEREALTIAAKLRAGSVLINDLIIPTSDPRVAFGGRASSGFGTTRGAEGLLEMTAVKNVLVRTDSPRRQWRSTGERHFEFFMGAVHASHGRTWIERWKGLRQLVRSARTLDR